MSHFINNGKITEPAEVITLTFIQSIVVGLTRYAGTAATSESGMERPLKVLLGGNEPGEYIRSMFEEALETAGIEHGDAGEITVPGLNFAFFDMDFDFAISVNEIRHNYEIEFFERGDNLGGLEATLPGGVNFEGTGSDEEGTDTSKQIVAKKYGLPLCQNGVNQIEMALEEHKNFRTFAVELHEDLSEDAEDRYESHLIDYINKVGPIMSVSQRKATDFSGINIMLEKVDSAADKIFCKVANALGARIVENGAILKVKFDEAGKSVKITVNDKVESISDIQDFISSYFGISSDSGIVKIHEDGIILPGEPLPDGILTALLIVKILAK